MRNNLILVLILLAVTSAAFTQTEVKNTSPSAVTPDQQKAINAVNSLNEKLIEFYQQQKYAEALQKGIEMQTLIESNGLGENLKVTPALTNLAEVYMARSKEGEAIKLFENVLGIYQKKAGEWSPQTAKMTERLTLAYFNKRDYRKAEGYALKAVALRVKLSGEDSKAAAAAYNDLANVYREEEKFDLANESYQRAIRIRDRVYTEQERKARNDLDAYQCFVHHWGFKKNDMVGKLNLLTEFNKSRRGPDDAADKIPKMVSSGVVNGKATYLAKPSFPRVTAALGSDGFVLVKVTIDENGNVMEAKGTCGMVLFVGVSEEAALKSKFSPTLLGGVPVKVSGIIVYNYDIR